MSEFSREEFTEISVNLGRASPMRPAPAWDDSAW